MGVGSLAQVPWRVLLVDGVAALRAQIRQALETAGGFAVVAEAADGAEALESAVRHQPELIVLDLALPDLAGSELLTRLRGVVPRALVVVYTGAYGEVTDALSEQVAGILRKDEDVRYLAKLCQDLAQRHEIAATLELGAEHRGVAVARGFIAEQCRRWGCLELVEDAKLVVTELVTNALVHTRTRCEIRANYEGHLLRVEVVDHGLGTPDPQLPTQLDDHGRGLLLVTALCAAWGVDARDDGRKIVWAELTYPPMLSRN